MAHEMQAMLPVSLSIFLNSQHFLILIKVVLARFGREYKEHSAKKDEPVERVSFLKSKSKDDGEDETLTSAKDFSSPYSSISSTALNRLVTTWTKQNFSSGEASDEELTK